jgi:hypothetical protein
LAEYIFIGIHKIDLSSTMKRCFFLLSIYCVAINCTAQIKFEKTYCIVNEVPSTLSESSTGDFYFCGMTNLFGPIVTLYKTDSAGNLKWCKYGPVNTVIGDVAYTHATENGGSVLFISEDDNLETGFRFIRLDSSGSVITSSVYHANYFTAVGQNVTATKDSGYLMTSSWGKVHVLKINKNGTPLWSRSYSTSSGVNMIPNVIRETHDGGFIVGGLFAFGGFTPVQIFIMRVDSNLHTVWASRYATTGSPLNQQCYDLIETKDGGVVLLGKTYLNSSSPASQWILKVNSSGTIAWQYKFTGSLNDGVFKSVKEKNSGNLVVTGLSTELNNDIDIRLMELDSSGQSIVQHDIGALVYDVPYDLILTHDGGCAVLASTSITSPIIANTQLLIRTDSTETTACYDTLRSYTQLAFNLVDTAIVMIDSGFTVNHAVSPYVFTDTIPVVTDFCTTISDAWNHEQTNNEISVFPNPWTEMTCIQLPEHSTGDWQLKIYNLQGEELWTATVSDHRCNLFEKNFSKGLYILIAANAGFSYHKKMIIY